MLRVLLDTAPFQKCGPMTQTDKAQFRHLSDGAHSWYSLVRQPWFWP